MSIAPPSDIILDVAQAADPVRREAAVAKLAQLAGGAPADFSTALGGAGPTRAAFGLRTAPSVAAGEIGTMGAPQHAARALSPYQKFEAVLLQTAFQDILPKDDELFGDAASADACRSMLAEQLANQMAASGRFGVAKAIEKHGAASTAAQMQAVDLGARGLHGLAAAAAGQAPLPSLRPVTRSATGAAG